MSYKSRVRNNTFEVGEEGRNEAIASRTRNTVRSQTSNKKTVLDEKNILEERNNYLLYVSGVGFVDANGEPIKNEVEKVRRAPEPPKPIKRIKIEYEPKVETTYEKISVEENKEPNYSFNNLGIYAKTNDEGKKVYYRVIEAVPDEEEEFDIYKKVTTTTYEPKETAFTCTDPYCQKCHKEFRLAPDP